MHNHIFRKIDAARLCEQKLGLAAGTIVSVDADNDGMVDGEIVLLHSDDLSTLQSGGVPADTVYFGDFVIQGYDGEVVKLITSVNSVDSVGIYREESFLPIGNIIPCVIFDAISEYTGINAHFYGWKFTLQP